MKIKIEGKEISKNSTPYIVAELSANHGGSIDIAKATIASAKECGADAIKLQTYTPDSMTINCDKEEFIVNSGLWKDRNLYELYKEAYTPYEWHEELFNYAKEIGITCFSTPFDESAVDLLEDNEVPVYKIASFELTDLVLLEKIAQTEKPIILSTGMASIDEISRSINILKDNGNEELIVLHCVSGYPTSPKDANLRTMLDIEEKFQCLVGLSDHTMTHSTSLVAVTMGAVLIEKHFILDRDSGGPDSSFSMEPKDLETLRKSVDEAWEALGKVNYDLKGEEKEMIKFRRSLYAVQDIKAGEEFSPSNLRRIRPGYGIEPGEYRNILGKKAKVNIEYGTSLKWEMIDE